MTYEHIACDHELLRLSVEDCLSDEQEETLAQHLSECSRCQLALERLAAGEEAWFAERIEELLSKSPEATFGSAELLAGSLEECLAHVQQPRVLSLPDACGPPVESAKRVRKISPEVRFAAAATLIGMVATVYFVFSAKQNARSSATIPRAMAPRGSQAADDWDVPRERSLKPRSRAPEPVTP